MASPQLLQLAAKLRAEQGPAHHVNVRMALAFAPVLTEGERWFLNSLLLLKSLSERQWVRLHEIEAKAGRTL